MHTNELKKGDLVLMTSGFIASIEDNKKGSIHLIKILSLAGAYEEMGSSYVWRFTAKLRRLDETVDEGRTAGFAKEADIELTPQQEKDRAAVESMGF